MRPTKPPSRRTIRVWWRFCEGKGRPEWMNGAIAPLETMLQADAPDEKMAAALALLPLGHDEPALEVLHGLIAVATRPAG